LNILPRRIFDLIYGPAASAKSRNIFSLITQVHKETGKKARVIIGDGSLPSYDALIDAGLVDYAEFSARAWPQDTLMRFAQGWFPEHSDDPQSPLIAPTPEKLKDIGLTVFEGLSVAGSYIMGHVKGGFAARAAAGEKIGDSPGARIVEGDFDEKTGKMTDGPGTAFGGNSPGHYKQAQGVIVDIVQASKGIPHHVVWTAHEVASEQEQAFGDRQKGVPQKKVTLGEMIIGPEVAGKKLTGQIQRIYGNTLHTQTVPVKQKMKDPTTQRDVYDLRLEYRLWTRDHFSTQPEVMLRYKAATRDVDERTFPAYFTALEPGQSIIDYYAALAEHKRQFVNQLRGETS
jgi:hypothetical protein